MRLTEQQRYFIVQAVKENVSVDAKVWLFGSRCREDAKGGDIDIYIETPPVESGFKSKIRLKIALEDLLGEQKSDVLLHQLGTPELPIHTVAKKTGILLG